MSEPVYAVVLLASVAWPAVLAIPAVHTRVPGARILGVLPAFILTVVPGSGSVHLSWLLFGTELATDGEVRWLLGMSVAVWVMAALVAPSRQGDCAANRTTTFFQLTQAGHIGAILATDLTGFIAFSTIMGYAFYAMLAACANDSEQLFIRPYLVVLVIADVLLVEALLLAAASTNDLRFDAVRQIMAESAYAYAYLWFLFAGFALKAGAWPCHRWLTAAARPAHPFSPLLTGAVPVAIALLGAARSLPFGAHAFSHPGGIAVAVGSIGVVVAALTLFRRRAEGTVPVGMTVVVSGTALAAAGAGLARPDLWAQYAGLAYPGLAGAGVLLATAGLFTLRCPRGPAPAAAAGSRNAHVFGRLKRPFRTAQHAAGRTPALLRQMQRGLETVLAELLRPPFSTRETERPPIPWAGAIVTFIVLGLAVAWLAAT